MNEFLDIEPHLTQTKVSFKPKIFATPTHKFFLAKQFLRPQSSYSPPALDAPAIPINKQPLVLSANKMNSV
jgi:hypothetical protein